MMDILDLTQNIENDETEEEISSYQNSQKEDNISSAEPSVKEYGQALLNKNKHKIQLITIIGEIEGHEQLPGQRKSTKYEHLLPQLAAIEDDNSIEGILILNNTIGGDVSCGLALAEMIASLSKPKVSLVIGDSHSIGVPLAVASDYSFIVSTGTMIIHPVRMNGMVIGAQQTYNYFQLIEERILNFISTHCSAKKERIREMMMDTGMMTKDLGTLLVGQEAVKEGLINEVGGLKEAMKKLYDLIEQQENNSK